MLTYDAALAKVLATVPAPPVRELAIREADGLVLAQEVVADADMPAFDRTAMDGYALRSADANKPGRACDASARSEPVAKRSAEASAPASAPRSTPAHRFPTVRMPS